MERPRQIRKTLAILSAIVLVTGLVLYRAGIIGDHYMSGSKSTFVFVGGQPIKPPADGPQSPPTPAPAPPAKGE